MRLRIVRCRGAIIYPLTCDRTAQADAGYADIGGVRHSAVLGPEIARWSVVISPRGGRAVDGTLPMESRLENRLCHLTINCGGGKTYRGLAYNERCFGTLG